MVEALVEALVLELPLVALVEALELPLVTLALEVEALEVLDPPSL